MTIKFPYPQSIHEIEIIKHFSEKNILLPSENKNKIELGIFIVFSNRSGSNLLGEYLSLHPNIGMAEEIFNHPQVIRVAKSNNITYFEDYLQRIILDQQVDNVFITKISPYQLAFLLRFDLLKRNFNNIKVISIFRQDLLAQAISHEIAIQNEQWTSFFKPKKEKVQYNEERIIKIIRHFGKIIGFAEMLNGLFGLDVYRVTYEEFILEKTKVCQEILEFLGFQDEEGLFNNYKPRHQKQTMEEKDRFYKRFRENFSINTINTGRIKLIPNNEKQ